MREKIDDIQATRSTNLEEELNFSNLPEKRKQIFEAAIRLYTKGINFHTITVANIAKEAGIGKGTIYEYFHSKEEIIWKSVAFYYYKSEKVIYEKIREKHTFADKLDVLFDWMEQNIEMNITCVEILISVAGNKMDKNSCKEMMHLIDFDLHFTVVKEVILVGVAEKKIQNPVNKLQFHQACQVLLAFMYYLLAPEKYEGINHRQARKQCKDTLVKILT